MSKLKFKKEIKDLFAAAFRKAYKEQSKVNLRDGESPDACFDRSVEAFSDTLSNELSEKLPEIIKSFMESAEITHVLATPQGTVTGTIKIVIK